MKPETGRRLTIEESAIPVWELAQFLRNTEEKLDPTGSGEWDDLPFEEREFYRDVILDLLEARDLIERAWRSNSSS